MPTSVGNTGNPPTGQILETYHPQTHHFFFTLKEYLSLATAERLSVAHTGEESAVVSRTH